MSGQANESWRYDFSTASGKEKTIRVIHGDLCWTFLCMIWRNRRNWI